MKYKVELKTGKQIFCNSYLIKEGLLFYSDIERDLFISPTSFVRMEDVSHAYLSPTHLISEPIEIVHKLLYEIDTSKIIEQLEAIILAFKQA